jgi:hypothetical protein
MVQKWWCDKDFWYTLKNLDLYMFVQGWKWILVLICVEKVGV